MPAKAKNRGKIERRNRRRMEAIAHWMQCRSISTGKSQRAVVPFSDLSDFLTRHIAEVEKLTDSENEPQDLSNEFLEFVKKRAGLLIEVGENQYSFVHLTFQEYLTSSHIMTISEKDGITGIWKAIRQYSSDPRWHEVVRLLVAGLKSNESQRGIIELILNEGQGEAGVSSALLLGGILLDGIEAAEERDDEIFSRLISSANVADNTDMLRRILMIIRAWAAKERSNRDSILSAFETSKKVLTDHATIALRLNAISLELPEIAEISASKGSSIVTNDPSEMISSFFQGPEDIGTPRPRLPNIEVLWAIQDMFALTSPHFNLVAATTRVMNLPFGEEVVAERSFYEQLVALSYGPGSGPFAEFAYNSLLFSNLAEPYGSKLRVFKSSYGGDLTDRRREKVDTRFHHELFDTIRKARGNPKRFEGRELAQFRVKKLAPKLITDVYRGNHRTSVRTEAALRKARSFSEESGVSFSKSVLGNPDLYMAMLELYCDAFRLRPRAQWLEALRIAFLPTIPSRLNNINRIVFADMEQAFHERRFGQTEIHCAAYQLLIDTWFWTQEYYAHPNDSPFLELAGLTRDVDSPPLRIAHCIRDIAYGDMSRAEDMISMIQSDQPEYSSIFESCLWKTDKKISRQSISISKRGQKRAKRE